MSDLTYWNGTAHVSVTNPLIWNGTAFVPPAAIHIWDGSKYVKIWPPAN